MSEGSLGSCSPRKQLYCSRIHADAARVRCGRRHPISVCTSHAQPAQPVAGPRLAAIHVPAQQHWVTARRRSGIRHCPVRRFAHPALPIAVAPGRRSNRPGGTTGRHARSAAEIHGRLSPTWPLPESPQVFPQCASENRPHKNHAACRSAPMLPIPQLDAYSFLRASWLLARVEFKR